MLKKEFDFPPYHVMVENLFKKDMPGNFGMLLHAALGIAGEGGELKEADSRQNAIEECGDLEFYMKAAELEIIKAKKTDLEMGLNLSVFPLPQINLYNWAEILHKNGSKIIDFTKKAWVYGNREPDFTGVHVSLREMRAALAFGYELLGVTREEVLYQNQIKLIGKDGRYKSGTYSDAAALAREDKIVPLEMTKISPESIVTPKLSVLGDGGLAPAVTPGLTELDDLATKFLDSREETVQVHSSKDDEHKPRFVEVLSNTKIKG